MERGKSGEICKRCGEDLYHKPKYRIDTFPDNGGYPSPEEDLCTDCHKDYVKDVKKYFETGDVSHLTKHIDD